MRWLIPAGVMVAAVLWAAVAVCPGQANEDEAVRLQAENKILRSELDRRNKEIEALKAEIEKLANEVKMLREVCEKAGIAPPAEDAKVGKAVEDPKPQAPESPKGDSAPLSISYIERLIRQTYTLEPGETALRTAQRRKELDDAVIGKQVVLSAVVTQVTKLPGIFQDETVAQVVLQQKSRETVEEAVKVKIGGSGYPPMDGVLGMQLPRLDVSIVTTMDRVKAGKLREGQVMRLEGRVESFGVERASAKGSVQFEMGVEIENKPSE